jgi:hypothetical protein
MHQQLLAKLSLPLGELWKLGPLARHTRTPGEREAFASIKPLNITRAPRIARENPRDHLRTAGPSGPLRI